MQNRHDCKRLSIHNDLNHIAVLVVTAVEQLDLVLFAAANIEKTSHDSWICWMLQCERLWTEFIAGMCDVGLSPGGENAIFTKRDTQE